MMSSRELRREMRSRPVTEQIASRLSPNAFDDSLWTSPHLKRLQERLRHAALKQARSVLRIARKPS